MDFIPFMTKNTAPIGVHDVHIYRSVVMTLCLCKHKYQ